MRVQLDIVCVDFALTEVDALQVQIEVPPPRTQEQRVSILKVHTKTMFEAGRILVRDAPPGTSADRQLKNVSVHGVWRLTTEFCKVSESNMFLCHLG